jgi:hypothetical protein
MAIKQGMQAGGMAKRCVLGSVAGGGIGTGAESMTDKRHHEMTPAEKIGYMQQKMATAKSFESPVLTVPIADLEIVMAALEEKDQRIKDLEDSAALDQYQIKTLEALADQNDKQRDHWMERAKAAEQRLQQSIELPDARSQEYWFDAVFQRQKFDRDVEKHIHALNLRLRSRGE